MQPGILFHLLDHLRVGFINSRKLPLSCSRVLGFPYVPLGVMEWMYLIAAIIVASSAMPLSLIRPSGLVVFLLYLFVFLPSLTITLAAKPVALSIYGAELSALVCGFVFVAFGTRVLAPASRSCSRNISVSAGGQRFLVFGCFALFIFILFSFRDRIDFVGLDDIYTQRVAGRSRNAAERMVRPIWLMFLHLQCIRWVS